MSKDKTDARSRAEQRFDKAQKTNDDSRATIANEVQAQRKKTARLREQRLAKEAADSAAEQEKAAAAPKKRTRAKSAPA